MSDKEEVQKRVKNYSLKRNLFFGAPKTNDDLEESVLMTKIKTINWLQRKFGNEEIKDLDALDKIENFRNMQMTWTSTRDQFSLQSRYRLS